MNKKDIILIIILVIWTIVLGVCYKIKYNNLMDINTNKQIDTIYNKVILDSIEWNIIKRDTIIYNIKTEMKDEIEKSKLVNDSDAIKLFNKLVTE